MAWVPALAGDIAVSVFLAACDRPGVVGALKMFATSETGMFVAALFTDTGAGGTAVRMECVMWAGCWGRIKFAGRAL